MFARYLRGRFVAFLCVLSGVTAVAQDIPELRIDGAAADINEWLVIGPFWAGAGVAALDNDFLAPLGMESESALSAGLGQWVKSFAGKSSVELRVARDGLGEHLDWLFGEAFPEGSQQSAAYLLSNLLLDEDRNAWLVLGSNDEMRVWLNGEEVHASRGQRTLWGARDVVRLRLRKGTNVLAIKVSNLAKMSWGVTARLETSEMAAAVSALDASGVLVRSTLVPADGRLDFAIKGWSKAVKPQVWVEDFQGRQIGSGELVDGFIQIPPLLAGRLRISLGGVEKSVEIAAGPLSRIRADMVAGLAAMKVDNRLRINFETLLRRVEILREANESDEASNPGPSLFREENDWKAAYAYARFKEALDHMSQGEEPFRHRPGLHIRGFRSKIDDQPMHYRLFVPSTYRPDGPPLPMVVIPATTTSANRPFIASAFIADHGTAEGLGKIAEQFGLGLLWTGYRVEPFGGPVDLANFDEALEAVREDYNLDETRITIWAHSSAGVVASLAALRHPGQFAAMALRNAVMHRDGHRRNLAYDFRGNRAYSDYLEEADPFERLAEHRDFPIWILNDAKDSAHRKFIPQEREFVELARSYRADPMVIFEHSEDPTRAFLESLRWLSRQRREHVAKLKLDCRVPDGMASVFAERFIVVLPTGGCASERSANDALCRELSDAWLRTNHVSCRIISDVDLRLDEEYVSNLILIGNEHTNVVWARLAPALNIQLRDNRITVRGNAWSGAGLSLQTWCPHPVIVGRKIAFLGAANVERATFGTYELALDGWFDCAVWRQSPSGKPVLVDAVRWGKGQDFDGGNREEADTSRQRMVGSSPLGDGS